MSDSVSAAVSNHRLHDGWNIISDGRNPHGSLVLVQDGHAVGSVVFRKHDGRYVTHGINGDEPRTFHDMLAAIHSVNVSNGVTDLLTASNAEAIGDWTAIDGAVAVDRPDGKHMEPVTVDWGSQ